MKFIWHGIIYNVDRFRLSFPSGHSSFSAYTMIYLAVSSSFSFVFSSNLWLCTIAWFRYRSIFFFYDEKFEWQQRDICLIVWNFYLLSQSQMVITYFMLFSKLEVGRVDPKLTVIFYVMVLDFYNYVCSLDM